MDMNENYDEIDAENDNDNESDDDAMTTHEKHTITEDRQRDIRPNG